MCLLIQYVCYATIKYGELHGRTIDQVSIQNVSSWLISATDLYLLGLYLSDD